MELGKFATRENCENGVWVEPIIFGEATGIELCILGSDADKVRRHAAATLREIQAMTAPEKERVNYVERTRDDVVARTVGIRVKGSDAQVTIGGAVVEDTPAGYRKLYTEIPEIQAFVKEFSDKRANFLPKKNTSSSEQSDDSSSSATRTASEKETSDK